MGAVKKPVGDTAKKEQARSLLIGGASFAKVKKAIGAGGDEILAAALADMDVPSAEEATRVNIERLNYLAGKLMPKAEEGEEVAANAVVRIIQAHQQLVLGYQALSPKEVAQIEKFRTANEARKKKNRSNLT